MTGCSLLFYRIYLSVHGDLECAVSAATATPTTSAT